MEETDVEEILLAYKQSRQLRGEQRVNRGYRPMTGRTSGGKPYRVEGRLNITELISRTRRICREKGHWARECPNKGKQVPGDGEEVKTSIFVYFGGDHSTPGYIGKGLIDTGCSRFWVGQSTLEKWERMRTRRWHLSTPRVQLEKATTFRLCNDETLETTALAVLPVGIAGVNGVLRVNVVPGGAPLVLSKEFLRDLGCHIDLDRGHLFFEKLGVRAVVTSEQSPHLLLHLTIFEPQGHKIPERSVLTNVQSAMQHVTARDRTKYIRASPQHLITEHQKLIATTLNLCIERMDKRKTLAMRRETTGKTERDDG